MIPHVSITLRILQSTLRYFIFFNLHNGPGIRSASGSPLEMQMRPGEVKDLLRSHSKLVIEWQHKLWSPNPSPVGSSQLKSERKGANRQANEWKHWLLGVPDFSCPLWKKLQTRRTILCHLREKVCSYTGIQLLKTRQGKSVLGPVLIASIFSLFSLAFPSRL